MKDPARLTARSHSNAIKETKEDSARDFHCKSAFKAVIVASPKRLLSLLLKTSPWLKLRKHEPRAFR